MNGSGSKSLLGYLAAQMHCTYESDLCYLDAVGKWRLLHIIEKVPAEDYSLFDWNDALKYLTSHEKSGDSAEQVRAALLSELSASFE